MKNFEELYTNLSHVKTCQNDDSLFGNLELIAHRIKDKNAVCHLLNQTRELIRLEMPLVIRVVFFKRLNSLLSELMTEYCHDKMVFSLFFDLMSLFKEKIDDCPQEDSDQSEDEWLELEKSVYSLCDWEDAVLNQNPGILSHLYLYK